ncbi:MAG: glycosyltransferase [Clostridia bacterium]|nr:glycosyltransferase [Clostridia bacterium]
MRALLLSTHTGGGHDAAAQAMKEALEEREVECRLMDSVAFGGEAFSRAVSATYVNMVKRSTRTFGKVYHMGEVVRHAPGPSPVYLVNAAYARNLARELQSFRPQMVVCTHLFPGQSMTYLRKHGAYDGVLGMVQTDYTFIPFSEEVKADLIFAGHRDMLRECGRDRIDPSRVHVTGIPVSLACTRKPFEDHGEHMRIVLAGGSMGAGDLPGAVRCIRTVLPEGAEVDVVAGSNEKAQAEAEKAAQGDTRIRVHGSVHPLSDLVSKADLLITKSGGLTSTEAMVMGTPMLIYQAIEGCETINAELFERNGLAWWARNEAEFVEKLPFLLAHPEARSAMVEAQFSQIPSDPARKCAELLLREVLSRV